MLQGERIALRQMRSADSEILLQWENDPNNWHLSQTTRAYSKADIDQFITNTKDIYLDEQLRLIIELNEEERPIGTLDIFECDFHNKRGGLGILIADKKDRRRGFAYESIEMVKIYARDVLKFNQLFANILKSNEESQALFEKAGFVKCGEKKAWVKIAERYEDEWMYQLILA
ncbi:MAG: GNAT family protein [Bacteroidota bacterium]